jgi:hypothetical protein
MCLGRRLTGIFGAGKRKALGSSLPGQSKESFVGGPPSVESFHDQYGSLPEGHHLRLCRFNSKNCNCLETKILILDAICKIDPVWKLPMEGLKICVVAVTPRDLYHFPSRYRNAVFCCAPAIEILKLSSSEMPRGAVARFSMIKAISSLLIRSPSTAPAAPGSMF